MSNKICGLAAVLALLLLPLAVRPVAPSHDPRTATYHLRLARIVAAQAGAQGRAPAPGPRTTSA